MEIVEERLNEALTTYEKTYDGAYVRRSHRRQCRADVFVPIHLYGQLIQHKYGYSLLMQQVSKDYIRLLYPPYECTYRGYYGLVVVTPRPQTFHRSHDSLKNSYRIAFIFYM